MGWLFDGVISSLLVVVRVGVSRETWWVGGVFCSCSVFHVEHGWGCMCGSWDQRIIFGCIWRLDYVFLVGE